eukprot:COSAG06_NODE_46360_length_347_cov_1.072581_1_plen_115_part_11
MVAGRSAMLAEIFYRMTVQNEVLPFLYGCRALSGPLEAIFFVAVFEFRGKFFEKYVRRFQKKARKQTEKARGLTLKQNELLRQNLAIYGHGSDALKDVGLASIKGVQRGVAESSK